MPVRKKTTMKRKQSPLTETESNWLYDQCLNPGGDGMFYFTDADAKQALWTRNRDDVLTWWTVNKPCTRPSNWWRYDAPVERVPWCEGWEYYAVQPYRQRLGGVGEPGHDAHTLEGIPQSWHDDQRDPLDPPRFESKAAYLQRHGLLTVAELAYLKKHPGLLKPEIVEAPC